MAHSPKPSRTALLLTLPLLATLAGCYAEARTGGVVTAEYVPAHVEVYPREYYDGHTVYLINDRWYYHDGARWVYYRQEPQVLERRRVVIRQAPPVVRQQTVVHEAPPAPVRHRHHYQVDPARRRAQQRHAPSAD